MNCEFCGHKFSTKYVLNNHQKRAKYCLDIQRGKGFDPVSDLYHCEYCQIDLDKTNKQRHLQNCKVRLNSLLENSFSEIEELKQKIRDQEKLIIELRRGEKMYKELAERELDCVETIAKQPKTTNNQTNNLMLLSPLDLNDRELFSRAIKESFSSTYLLEGQKGVAKFAVDKLLRDGNGKLKYICTDPSRQTYRFKTTDGTIERDIKAKKLTSAIAEDIIRQTYSISSNKIEDGNAEVFLLYSGNTQDINSIATDNGEFRSELASLTSVF